MHFARHVLLLYQAFGIATTIAAVAASQKCPTPASLIFILRVFDKNGKDKKLNAISGPEQGAVAFFRSSRFYPGVNCHLADYNGTTCVLHDSNNRVAVLAPGNGDNPLLYNATQVPGGSAPLQCALNSTTDVLACHAGSANKNNLVPLANFLYGWQLLDTKPNMPFIIKAFPPSSS